MLNPTILGVDELAAKPIVVSISLSDVQLPSQSFAARWGSSAFMHQRHESE